MKKSAKILVTLGAAGMLALTACATADVVDEIEAMFGLAPIAGIEPFEAAGGYMDIEGGPALLSPEDLDMLWSGTFDPETVQIIIHDEAIDAPTPFIDSQAGTVMLPLVAIAEALGYTVADEGEEVIIGPGTIVTAGVNSYSRGREAARELTSAPIIVDGVMFVPWEFFQEILSYAAMASDGNIIFAPTTP
ncbi:MAG: copper amine oxidase N-terminal domain-containing protein [Firmicutes bacterium]|nr:copper amine oxidase N-terminal domain-containing protein [Bacillota bacterium]